MTTMTSSGTPSWSDLEKLARTLIAQVWLNEYPAHREVLQAVEHRTPHADIARLEQEIAQRAKRDFEGNRDFGEVEGGRLWVRWQAAIALVTAAGGPGFKLGGFDAFHYANLADPAFVSDREPLPQPQRGDDLHPVVSRYLEAIDRGDQTGWSFGGDQITYIVLQPTEGRLTVNEAAETLAAGDHGLMGDVTWSEPPEIDIAATEHGAAIIDPRGRLGTWSPPAHWSGRYWIVGWTFDHDLIFESSRNLQADWQGAIAPLANYAESMRQELEDQGWSDSFVDEDEPDPMILLPYAVALAIVELDSGIVLDAALEDAAETIAVPERMPQE